MLEEVHVRTVETLNLPNLAKLDDAKVYKLIGEIFGKMLNRFCSRKN